MELYSNHSPSGVQLTDLFRMLNQYYFHVVYPRESPWDFLSSRKNS